MTHRHNRQRFRHAAPRQIRPVLTASAAVVVAAAATAAMAAAVPSGTTGDAETLALTGNRAGAGVAADRRQGVSSLGQVITVPGRGSAPPPVTIPVPPNAAKELAYQFQWQPNFFYCGPAATRIALSARGVLPTQDQIAGLLGTTVNGTNSADDISRVLTALSGKAYTSTFIPGSMASPYEISKLQADLVRDIEAGSPIVANIAGTTTDSEGFTHSYPGGHYLAAVGYSYGGAMVRIADPADARGNGVYWMTTQSFAHWIAQRGYAA